MGWLCAEKPDNVKEFLDRRFSSDVVIRSALKLTEYYAALQLSDGSVICAVYMLSFHKRHGRIEMCRKDMDETCGPNMQNCPEAILKLLTPLTDLIDPHGYAANWRKQCWENIAHRKLVSKYVPGTKVRLGRSTYTLVRKRGAAWEVHDATGFRPCRMSRSQLIKSEVVNEQA